MSKYKPYETLDWSAAKPLIEKAAPELASVIDAVGPDDKHQFIAVEYPYGATILDKGEFFMPNEYGELVRLSDGDLSEKTRDKLSYNLNSNPVSLVLDHCMELFATLTDRTIPITGLIPPGALLGAYRVLDRGPSLQPKFVWEMTAGARSIFMLSNIAEKDKHTRLQRQFDISESPPKRLIDHWNIFKALSNQVVSLDEWSTKMLLFSGDWFQHEDDPAWVRFNHYLMKTVWHGNQYYRNNFFWNAIFSITRSEEGLESSSYVASTIKHLFSIGIGELPGFAISEDDFAAPISVIQSIYKDFYRPRNNFFAIMHLANLSWGDGGNSVYYPLSYPIAVEFSPSPRSRVSGITDLCEIRSLLRRYIRVFNQGGYNLGGTPLFEIDKKVDFNYFHPDDKNFSEVQSTECIFDSDSSFFRYLADSSAGLPRLTSFSRGCIQVKKNDP